MPSIASADFAHAVMSLLREDRFLSTFKVSVRLVLVKLTGTLKADIHSQLCLAGFRDSGLSGFANLCGHRIVVRIRRLRISMKARKMNMAA